LPKNDFNEFEMSSDFCEYKRLLNKVVKKIDAWHDKTQEEAEVFVHDEDFIEYVNSPDKFGTSSSESQSETQVGLRKMRTENSNRKHY